MHGTRKSALRCVPTGRMTRRTSMRASGRRLALGRAARRSTSHGCGRLGAARRPGLRCRVCCARQGTLHVTDPTGTVHAGRSKKAIRNCCTAQFVASRTETSVSFCSKTRRLVSAGAGCVGRPRGRLRGQRRGSGRLRACAYPRRAAHEGPGPRRPPPSQPRLSPSWVPDPTVESLAPRLARIRDASMGSRATWGRPRPVWRPAPGRGCRLKRQGAVVVVLAGGRR